MSDKKKISLEDRGWGQMAAVLDRELPQKKNKKRLVLWFFIVGVLGLISAFFLNGEELNTDTLIAQEIDVNKTRVDEVAVQNMILKKPSKGNTNEINESKLEESNFDVKSINEPGAEFSNSTNNLKFTYQESNEIVSATPSSPTKTKTFSSIEKSKEIVFTTATKSSNLIDETKTLAEIAEMEQVELKKKTEKLVNQSSRNYLTLTNLTLLSSVLNSSRIEGIEIMEPSLGYENYPDEPIQVENTNSFYLFAGGRLGINPNGLGYKMGVGKRFGSGSFNFFVEAGYENMSYQNENSVSDSVLVVFTPDQNSTSNEFSELDNAIIQEAISNNNINTISSINNLNSIFITSGVNKSISNRFIVSLGLTYSMLLNIENRAVSYTSSNGLFQQELDVYNISKTALYDNGDFNKYELSTRLGIGYQLTPRLALSANYNHGLTDLIKITNTNASSDLPDLSDPNGESQSSFRSSVYRKSAEIRIDYSF